MAVFQGLSEKLNHIFSKLTKRGKLTELEIKQAMREVRIALLEADVNLSVAKDFIARVSEKAVGQDILKSLSPAQQVIKIVNEELTALMGSSNSKLIVSSSLPTVIMMCGLQGAGKTTLCGKLALYLKKQGKKPLLAACDVYRPAAIEQLKTVAGKVGVEVFEKGQINPVKISEEAIEYAKRYGRVDERTRKHRQGGKGRRNTSHRRLHDRSGRGQRSQDFRREIAAYGCGFNQTRRRYEGRRVPFDKSGNG